MSLLIAPARRQPQYGSPARSRVAPGMTGAWLLSPSGLVTPNLVTGQSSTNPAAGVIDSKSNYITGPVVGRNLNAVATANRPILGRTLKLFTATMGSVMLVARRNGSTDERGAWTGGGTSSVFVGPASMFFFTNGIWQFQPLAGGPLIDPTGGIDAGFSFSTVPEVYICTARDGSLITYQGGLQKASGSVNNGAVSDDDFSLSGDGNDTFEATDSSFYAVATWPFALSASQAWALSQNPWEPFLAPRRIYVNVAAAAAPATLMGQAWL